MAALDLIRDREHGVPRFNEFRRQYGLRQLTSFDDFVDQQLAADLRRERSEQEKLVQTLREVYGSTSATPPRSSPTRSVNADGTPINDCLGHPNGSHGRQRRGRRHRRRLARGIARPHGFAISETQFVVFILNASRRLFSDRFFTSSFRPEFYTTLGVDWVNNNGPGRRRWRRAGRTGTSSRSRR